MKLSNSLCNNLSYVERLQQVVIEVVYMFANECIEFNINIVTMIELSI